MLVFSLFDAAQLPSSLLIGGIAIVGLLKFLVAFPSERSSGDKLVM
jgi:hypothetical protein